MIAKEELTLAEIREKDGKGAIGENVRGRNH